MITHELVSPEHGSWQEIQRIYEINWPTQATEADIASLAVYMQEGRTADEAAAVLILRQAEQLMDVCLARAGERYQRIPQGVIRVVDSIFGRYTRPVRTLLNAREIEARGVQMPVLLDTEISDALRTQFVPALGETIERYEARIAWIEQGFIEDNLRTWETELNLLRFLEEKGPLGVVDYETDKSLGVLNTCHTYHHINVRLRKAVVLGRERFHDLYQAAQAL